MERERFLHEGRPRWRELETLLGEVEKTSLAKMGAVEVRRFGALYRRVAADLVYAKSRVTSGDVTDYLNDLVARSYAQVYARKPLRWRSAGELYARTFPRLFRAHARFVWLAMATLVVGGLSGAAAMHFSPVARGYVMPADHLHKSPRERVRETEAHGGSELSSGQSATFTAFLFTHNLRVTFLCFALGLTFGLGTLVVLFYNGLGVGALAYLYHEQGVGLFFWAWILPHGVPELFTVFLAGGAGLVIGRALISPGARTRAEALRDATKIGVTLILGTIPILVLAGFVEGTLSQIHEPAIPYAVKLAVAGALAIGLVLYLGFAGRRDESSASRERAIKQ